MFFFFFFFYCIHLPCDDAIGCSASTCGVMPRLHALAHGQETWSPRWTTTVISG